MKKQMKVLYVVGTCLTKNTSANMSHNAYIQGLLENNCDVDIVMALNSWGQSDSALPRWENARYYEYKSETVFDKFRKYNAQKLSNPSISGRLNSDLNKSITLDTKKKVRESLKNLYYTILPPDSVYPLEKVWLGQASKFRSKKHYDLVISNSSPAASHKLVVILSDRKHISYSRWIQIWEDPWYYDLYGGHTERIKSEEHYLLQRASEIYYVSPLTLEYQKKYYDDCASKMKCIPLPFLDFSMKDKDISASEISFGYFGDYYSKTRNLKPFYNALCETKIKGYIFGDSDLKLNSTNKIKVSGRVTLDELEVIQRQTGVLVHLCNLRGGQIPGKIYHYSATDKPILFILDGTDEEKKIIRGFFEKYHRYVFCNNDERSIKSAINEMSNNMGSCFGHSVEEFRPKVVVRGIL